MNTTTNNMLDDLPNELLNEYKEYIIKNAITNYDDFKLKTIKQNINIFAAFLDEYKQYNNTTYIYFKCIYYFCKEEYNLMMEISTDIEDPYILCLIGYYYQFIDINHDLMKKYHLAAIELNNIISMHYMGFYYQYNEKNYDLMKKYYMMAIELNNSHTMVQLASYYKFIERNYVQMEKYYLKAAKLNNVCAMNELGNYYKQKKKYTLMKEYYLMAIRLGNPEAMADLADYYYVYERNYILMKEYYLMAIKLNNKYAMYNLGYFHNYCNIDYDLMKKYYEMAISLNFSRAMLNLGYYYETIEKNNELASKYFYMTVNTDNSINAFKSFCICYNIENYHKYIYYPRILILILICRRQRVKSNPTFLNTIFLPQELYTIIFNEYIIEL